MCDLETSRMGAPYIYDISHLRVNPLKSSLDLFIFVRFIHLEELSLLIYEAVSIES